MSRRIGRHVEENRIGTVNDVHVLLALCQRRIDMGDFDFDDWVYRSRDAAAEFLGTMEKIGFEYVSPRRPRDGLKWLYKLCTYVPMV